MGMTLTQKILAAHAGLPEVKAGQLINAKLDIVLGNDITTPVAINEFERAGFNRVFDKEHIAIVLDHFVPNKPEVADSPGEHSWVIKATKDGTYTMEFKKLRPSTPDSVIDTKTFKLKAKPTTALQN